MSIFTLSRRSLERSSLPRLVISFGLVTALTLGTLAATEPPFWRCPPATEIFRGVTYGCEHLVPSDEGRGLLHWARIDLTEPGIELFVTPLDPTAVGQGWQYRLRHVSDVASKERLAVAINGSLFTSHSPLWLPLPGDFARGVETVVADHVVSHLWQYTALLWFDENLTPYLPPSKPPAAADLARAKWGIGGQSVRLVAGQVSPISGRIPDARTAVAIDRPRGTLFLAVGTHISQRLMLKKLADLGAKDGMLLDGGRSSAMVIGKDATGVVGGVVIGGWRPVATQFGVRARPLSAHRVRANEIVPMAETPRDLANNPVH